MSFVCPATDKGDGSKVSQGTSPSRLDVRYLRDVSRRGVIAFLLVVSGVMVNGGLRGTPVLGCSLLLGEEITGHLQLPLISRGV